MISRHRQCSSAANSASFTGTGCSRRCDGDSTAARPRQPVTIFGATSANTSAGTATARTASSFAISTSMLFRLTLPGSDRMAASVAGPSSSSASRTGANRRDQRQQPLTHRFRQPGRDPREQQLFAAMQGGSGHTVDAADSRWLDMLRPAAGQQMLPHRIWAPLDLGHMLDQPRHHRISIGHRALPEPQGTADLVAVKAIRPTGPLVERDLGPLDTDLPRDILHRGIRDLATPAREPSPFGIEAQHQREPKPRRAAYRSSDPARHRRASTDRSSRPGQAHEPTRARYTEVTTAHAGIPRSPLMTRFLPAPRETRHTGRL